MIIEKYDPMKGEMFKILDEEGKVINDEFMPSFSEEELTRFFRFMLTARMADKKAFALQREGRLGTYPQLAGHEAIQVGAAIAMGPKDWLFPHYRDLGAMLIRGVTLDRMYLYWMGIEEGSSFPDDVRVFPISIPVGSQIPIAVGHSWAAKIKKENYATIVSFGDGASSEGDFHEGMNFAGVFSTATVFLCSNNQWAISVPRERQTASATIAQKALAYGFGGILVDGNDVLAMYAATKEALDTARSSNIPTLIEAQTYRMADHTTADDATRYRPNDELLDWKKKDPVKRFRQFLQSMDIWSEEWEKTMIAEIDAMIKEAVSKAESFPAPTPEGIFKHTYGQMPPHLDEELAELKQSLEGHVPAGK